MVITQEYVDSVIPEMNEIVDFHNGIHPEFPYRVMEKDDVQVKSRKSIENIVGASLDDAAACYRLEQDRVYVMRDSLDTNMDLFSDLADYIDNKAILNDKEKLTLLVLLLHENGHRSTTTGVHGGEIRDSYLEAARTVYDHLGIKGIVMQLEEVRGFDGEMYSNGLKISFGHPKGKVHVGNESIDEFIVNFMTLSTLSNYLVRSGYISRDLFNPTMGFLLASRNHSESDDDFENAIKSLSRIDCAKFLYDYIYDKIPEKIMGMADDEDTLSGDATNVVLAQLVGTLDLFPGLVDGLYRR